MKRSLMIRGMAAFLLAGWFAAVAPAETLTINQPTGGLIYPNVATTVNLNCGTSGDGGRTSGYIATDCTATLGHGKVIPMVAVPANGYTFGAWTGDCAGQDWQCMLTMDSDKTFSATFQVVGTWTITMIPPAVGGMIYAGDAYCGNQYNTCTGTITSGDEAYVVAMPNVGYAFESWGGDCSGQGAQKCLVPQGDGKSVSATFASIGTARLTITPRPDGGLIYPNDASSAPFNCGVSGDGGKTEGYVASDCAATFTRGETTKIVAVPADGFTFAGWTGDCAGQDWQCELTMDGDKSMGANFSQ